MKTDLDNLLVEVEGAYAKSDIKKFCERFDHEWYYSLVTTAMVQSNPLILGFNFGASRGERYNPQSHISKNEDSFSNQDLGSISRVFHFCNKYFGRDFLLNASQSNYCFFRSQSENQITQLDIELCEPIFERLVDILSPSIVICLSSRLRDYLINTQRMNVDSHRDIMFQSGIHAMSYRAIKGRLHNGIPVLSLPHPNYRGMTGVARAEAWDFCCS